MRAYLLLGEASKSVFPRAGTALVVFRWARYTVPDFVRIGSAYGLRSRRLSDFDEIAACEEELSDLWPTL